MSDSYDSPWKEMLERYFPEFMAFFFPAAWRDIDWARGYESCDQELQQVARDAELGKRLADKLMKVSRCDGEAQWVFIHVEIQGEQDAELARRMYVYNYRLYDRYQRPIVSLAILGDDSAEWRPGRFEYTLWGCRAGLSFPVIKLRDFAARWDELKANDNPFAMIVMTHLKTRATRQDPKRRLRWKSRLVRLLYSKGLPRQDVLELFWFIDWLLALPTELEQQFRIDLAELEAEDTMRYVTSIERMGFRDGVASTLERLLERRFESLPDWVEQRLAKADREELERWGDRVIDAGTLEEVFATD